MHLELVLEVRDRAQALDDDLRSLLAREVDDERRERLRPDAPQVRGGRADEPRRSSTSNSVDPLRIGMFTTPTTTSSNSSDARVMTSRCPFVIGS